LFVCFFRQFEFPVAKKILRAHLAAGPALSFNSVLAACPAGTGVIRDETPDGILVPVRVEDTTWICLGATAAVGLDVPLSPLISLAFESRYFFAPRKKLRWTWTPGVYDGFRGRIIAFDFDEAAAAENAEETTPMTVAPSFFQIAAGLKLVF